MTTPNTLAREQVLAILKEAEAATRGPWRKPKLSINVIETPNKQRRITVEDNCHPDDVHDRDRREQLEGDAAFIAHSRENVPALATALLAAMEEVDAQAARIGELEADVEHWKRKATCYGNIVHACSPALAAAGYPVDATGEDGAVGGIAKAVETLTAELDAARKVLDKLPKMDGAGKV